MRLDARGYGLVVCFVSSDVLSIKCPSATLEEPRIDKEIPLFFGKAKEGTK